MDKNVERAYQAAMDARNNSYSPYSHFAVGAALKIKDSNVIFTGCNVENASYGGTICAERAALVSAVSQGHRDFEFLVVVTDCNPPALPCAFCRGVLAEFASGSLKIYLGDLEGIKRETTLGELLPEPFKF